MYISVIIPTHNPNIEILQKTLISVLNQSLCNDEYEVIIIDNGSDNPIEKVLNLCGDIKVVSEPKLGLTYARIRGYKESCGDLLVWCDDDNLLGPEYLLEALSYFKLRPKLGIAGGKAIPEYIVDPPVWHRIDRVPLGCRDLGDEELVGSWDLKEPHYPSYAPIGAGMVIRREAMFLWIEALRNDGSRLCFGRKGGSLASGEDNDINLTVIRHGWDMAYVPQLSLRHVIPPSRLTLGYQKRIARSCFRDFVRVLDIHGIRPWSKVHPATVGIRSLRAWYKCKAWKGPQEAIKWQGSVGQLEGRALLYTQS